MGSVSWTLLGHGTEQLTKCIMAGKPDPYSGIDFDEINEATALEVDEIKCLKNCFDLFDAKKQDFLSADDLDEILRAMGFRPSKEELMDILAEIDEDGSGEIEFAEFCQLCAKFLVEDPDIDTMKRELKDAFRNDDESTRKLRNLSTFEYYIFLSFVFLVTTGVSFLGLSKHKLNLCLEYLLLFCYCDHFPLLIIHE